MDKEVKITITTTQIQDGEAHNMKFEQDGQYFAKGEHHYILYEEPVENSKEVIKNRIKFAENFMEVCKKGPLTSTMYFETGKNYPAEYQTPFGKMMLAMHTHDYYVKTIEEKTITIGVRYDLSVDGGHLADCQMQIRIDSKK